MSVDEMRIVTFIDKWVSSLEARRSSRPWGFDHVRIAVLRKLAQAIREEKHR